MLADLLALTIPHEDIDEVLALARSLDGSLLEQHVASLLDHMGSFEHPPRLPPQPEQHPLFYVPVFLEVLPHVRAYHGAHGISELDSRMTLADLGRHVAVHRRRYGTPGLDPANWLSLAFRGMIYQVGRLQFERVPIGAELSQTLDRAPTDLALSVHIPEFCGPLSPPAVDEAFARARVFFARHFPSERYDFAVCHSWLLSPQLAAHLPPESNILSFQRRFTLVSTAVNDNTFQRFVLSGTRLRDIVEEGIARGESWLAGSGYLSLEE